MMLSEHFSLEEMVFSQTASRLGIDNTPPPEAVAALYDLAACLEEVRVLLGTPIIISSGYRSPELNRAVGGSTSSAHILGMAADFVSPPRTPLDICRLIEGSEIGFDQLIHEHDWVHFAIGPGQRREVLTVRHGGYIGLQPSGVLERGT
jgi:zinc D-Ala-D-Ala carboxypeptidase